MHISIRTLNAETTRALKTIALYTRQTISFIRTPYNLDNINGVGGLSVNHCRQSYEQRKTQHFTLSISVGRELCYVASNYARNINSKNDIAFSMWNEFM